MVCLTRLNGSAVYINPDLVRLIESKPDTLITFIDGQQLMVKDKADEIVKKVVEFKKTIMVGAFDNK